jgi:hypothetical protein
MFLKERVRFVKLNGTRGYRHDATPLLLKISIIDLFGFSQPERHAEVKRGLFALKKRSRAFWGTLGRFLPLSACPRRLERAVLYFLRGCCVKK